MNQGNINCLMINLDLDYYSPKCGSLPAVLEIATQHIGVGQRQQRVKERRLDENKKNGFDTCRKHKILLFILPAVKISTLKGKSLLDKFKLERKIYFGRKLPLTKF